MLAVIALVVSALGFAWLTLIVWSIAESDYFGEPSTRLVLVGYAAALGLIGGSVAAYGLVRRAHSPARAWPIAPIGAIVALLLVLVVDVYVLVAAMDFPQSRRRRTDWASR